MEVVLALAVRLRNQSGRRPRAVLIRNFQRELGFAGLQPQADHQPVIRQLEAGVVEIPDLRGRAGCRPQHQCPHDLVRRRAEVDLDLRPSRTSIRSMRNDARRGEPKHNPDRGEAD